MSDPRDWPWMPPVLEGARSLAGAHAVLLHGATGDGLLEAALLVARQWLCEADDGTARPCGHCKGCTLVAAHSHPDLRLLLPEALARELGLGEGGDEPGGADGEGKARRKPSRQVRIDEVRAAIDWVATSSTRGRGKVVLVHPADAMNLQAANALLKTLEEPPASARLLLATPQPALLLPTVRSRCQALRLKPPTPAQAREWLAARGVADAQVLLAAASGHPLEAASLAAAGIDAARWTALPNAVLSQQTAAFAGWALPQVLDALLKLCHDGLARSAGATPRFFPPGSVPTPESLVALADWQRQLLRWARRADHPWNESLALEALLQHGAIAWRGGPAASDTLVA